MGIANKCFEILENRRSADSWDGRRPSSSLGGPSGSGLDEEDGAADSEREDEEDEDEGAVEGEEEDGEGEVVEEVDETESEGDGGSEDSESEDSESVGDRGGGGRRTARLRLREILFYDDKVAIFKARHGRL